MPARIRNQKVENPTRNNGSEKAIVVRDRQKPRFYRKRKATLTAYYAGKGKFLSARAEARKVQAENVQMKWEMRISTLLG